MTNQTLIRDDRALDGRAGEHPPILELEPAMRTTAALPRRAIAAGKLNVEVMTLRDCAPLAPAWRDLAGRSLESNAYFQPALMLAAARHLPALMPPMVLLVWQTLPKGRRLVGLMPMRGSRSGMGPRAIAGFSSPYHSLGVPLLDRDLASQALESLLDHLVRIEPALAGLHMDNLPLDGPFASVLSDLARRTGRNLTLTPLGRRAILRPLGPGEESLDDRLGAKRRRELARLERNLMALGAVRYYEARGQEAQAALESFLALEASGWKGERGTALLQTARSSSFIRSAFRDFLPPDQGRVVWLSLDGRPIAAGLIFDAPGRSWFAKIAYDEALAPVSPGVQLVMAFSRRQAKNPSIHLTDSCATPDHPLMDPLWRDTMAMGEALIGIHPGQSPGLIAVTLREKLARDLRRRLKAALEVAGLRKPHRRPGGAVRTRPAADA